MSDIIAPREAWEITNITTVAVSILDIPTQVTIPIGATIDVLTFGNNTANSIANSINYRNLLNAGSITSTGYLHAHDDTAFADHTHTQFNDMLMVTAADSIFVKLPVFQTLTDSVVSLQGDLAEYVRKDGSITQLSDITSIGSVIEDAVSKAHDAAHNIESHSDTIATGAELNLLTDGRNADCLHTHISLEGVHNELTGIQGGVEDQYYHFTSAQHLEITAFFAATDITGVEAETLTDGSEADALHTHIAFQHLIVRKAYCAEDAPGVASIMCYLDDDQPSAGWKDPSIEIIVNCYITENANLNQAIPRLKDGDLIFVIYISSERQWWCVTTFQASCVGTDTCA